MEHVIERRVHGSVVRGSVREGVAAFRGIPFAHPPTAGLRFCRARRLGLPGVIDALEFGPSPVQPVTRWSPPDLSTSESSLVLNVWAPEHGHSLPVIVWVHGGGFLGGTASTRRSDAGGLSRLGQVVVVTLNYRVGALGFADLEGHGRDANAGVSDVLAGLQWVKEHIADMGGDPTNVTLAGHSAGAFLVGALLAVPKAQGLYQRAAMLSGGPWRVIPDGIARSVGAEFLDRLGLADDRELDQVSVGRILRAQDSLGGRSVIDRYGPEPRVLGVVQELGTDPLVSAHPAELVARGTSRNVPLLLTWTSDEFLGFPDEAEGRSSAGVSPLLDAWGAPPERVSSLSSHYSVDARRVLPGVDRLLSDWMYALPAARTAVAQANAGGAAWLGEVQRGDATAHGADVADIFSGDRRQKSGTLNTVLRFATSGDPGWDPVDPSRPVRAAVRDDSVSETASVTELIDRWEGVERP